MAVFVHILLALATMLVKPSQCDSSRGRSVTHGGKIVRDCSIHRSDKNFPSPEPFFVKKDPDWESIGDAIHLPNPTTGLLEFKIGERVRVACPGRKIAALKRSEVTVLCIGNNLFQPVGEAIGALGFQDLKCDSRVETVAERIGKCYKWQYTAIEIGYKFNKNEFLPLMYVCFNELLSETIYSRHLVQGQYLQKGLQINSVPAEYKDGGFYDKSINLAQLYSLENQCLVFNETLELDIRLQHFIPAQLSPFSHLASILQTHPKVSLYYINLAPQWKSFTVGIWRALDDAVKDFAIQKELELLVYSGPFGGLQKVVSINDYDNEYDYYEYYEEYYYDAEQASDVLDNVYLGYSETQGKFILRVPKLFWRIVYDQKREKGVAFILTNDRSKKNRTSECKKNIISDIKWLHIDDPYKYLHACDLRATSGIVLDLPVAPWPLSGGILDDDDGHIDEGYD